MPRTLSGSRFLQPKLSRVFNRKVAKPLVKVSRFLSGMAARTAELAQKRIAASIAALKRVLNKPPPPPPPRIKSMFLEKAASSPRKKPPGFTPL